MGVYKCQRSDFRASRRLGRGVKIILDLCGGSGAWSRPYAEAGYDVRLITLPQDVRLYQPPDCVHGILAAPPCTVFSRAGNRWPRTDDDMRAGLSVVDACVRIVHATRPQFWCLENPMGRLKRWLGKPHAYFHPCDYGDPWTKHTALWGSFTMPTKTPVEPTMGSVTWRCMGGKDKEKRAITPPGFCKSVLRQQPLTVVWPFPWQIRMRRGTRIKNRPDYFGL